MKFLRMKKSNFPYLVFVLINVAIALSCYFYPVSRDEFYYLNKSEITSVFSEYYQSYLFINPRIGQFFSNLVSRNILIEVVFGVLLFNAYIAVLFLNIYRKLPNFRKGEEIRRFLWLAAFFILLINYFGEMFYYTPYSGNYTLTHVFYLYFVFVSSEFYFRDNEKVLKKMPYLFLVILGIFIGMSNEHVPPVLVGISFLLAVIYFIKNRKSPTLKIILFPIFITVGYAFLFFAPANKIKQANVGKSVLDIGWSDYLSNWVQILKTYFYYNAELILISIILVLSLLIWNKKSKKEPFLREEILFWSALFLIPLMIVAVSPLIGTRLLFFSNSILIIVLFRIILALVELKKFKMSNVLVYGFLLLFFGMSVIMTFRANQNYKMLTSEIEQKKKETKDIELDHQLNYFTLDIGNYLNRKIFLESGEDYIDKDASQDNSMEFNLKKYFQLQSLKEK